MSAWTPKRKARQILKRVGEATDKTIEFHDRGSGFIELRLAMTGMAVPIVLLGGDNLDTLASIVAGAIAKRDEHEAAMTAAEAALVGDVEESPDGPD